MKFLVAFALCLTFAAVLAVTEEEVKQKLKAAHDKCQADATTAVDEEALKAFKASKGKDPAPANIGPHSLCVSKALGWQNDDGTVNKAHLKEKIAESVHDSTKVDEIVSECTVEQANDVATAEHLFKCFWKHAKAEHHH